MQESAIYFSSLFLKKVYLNKFEKLPRQLPINIIMGSKIISALLINRGMGLEEKTVFLLVLGINRECQLKGREDVHNTLS